MVTGLAFILRRAHSDQEPVLVLVDGRVWEGHIQDLALDTVVAVVRPVGTQGSYTEQRWHLDQIADMSLRSLEGDEQEAEDELFANARLMVQQAREYGEMSLAERLLKERATREEQHHGRG